MIHRLILLAAAGLLAACGGSQDPAAPAAAGNGTAPYREGVHWHRIATPVAAADNEVVEAFSYACPACAQFQPELDAWKRERGDAVSLRYVPVVFSPAWDPHARMYHAAQAMGALSRLHRAICDVLEVAVPVGGAVVKSGRAVADPATGRDFLRAHGRTGQLCPNCAPEVLDERGAPRQEASLATPAPPEAPRIVRAFLAGRGTYFCAVCQLAPE